MAACILAGCSFAPTLNRPPAIQEVASLDDAQLAPFAIEHRTRSADDDERAHRVGVYVVEPFDPTRTPVMFIHGVNGSPQDFRYLVDRLDRTRFQPWLFHYPQGVGLAEVAAQLQEIMAVLRLRFGVRSVAIVAHSMGGLIARDLLLRRSRPPPPAVPLLITLSTPWDGHHGAALGARFAIAAPPTWRDMSPGSAYLTSLFGGARGEHRSMPQETQHHLLFSYRKGRVSLGASGDEVVSLASQLLEPAQEQAARIYGFDATHTGILNDAAVATLVEQLLNESHTDSRIAGVR